MKIIRFPEELVYQIKSFEKAPIEIYKNAIEGSLVVARAISEAILAKAEKNENLILGLATGSSPIQVYKELVRMHREEGLSFANVITFNLDEYFGLKPENHQSYHFFMYDHLFSHIDIPQENIHIPKGDLKIARVEAYCNDYEALIEKHGGIDIQILGIGRTGHVAFNEPGSRRNSLTRLIRLDSLTRTDAASDFDGIANVPFKAITMGVNTVMSAKEIYLLAWGQHKAGVIKNSIEDLITDQIPASYLQEHPNLTYIIDKAAATGLTRVKHPWKVGNCDWTEDLICRAVIWLSQTINKPLLKLTDNDYNEHGLSELLFKVSNAYQLNIKIFNRLQSTITGWPGGKPNTDDARRPERAKPGKKRVIIFSPHPDDDVISMGGTFSRLVEQGHEVHVAYQTSGNIAVHHHDVVRYFEFFEEYAGVVDLELKNNKILNETREQILNVTPGQNTEHIRRINGLIRRGEARAGARNCGLAPENIHFLDLPFYESGSTRKSDPSEADCKITLDLINEIKPHQIFAAGDLADPHGTHRICLNIIIDALSMIKSKKWSKDCWLWLYRGAWQEYSIDEIEMTVPLSPEELLRKRKAIFMHQSQKDSAPFPGNDFREFWQRSEDRNRETASLYRKLGFAEYEAMEAFKRWQY